MSRDIDNSAVDKAIRKSKITQGRAREDDATSDKRAAGDDPVQLLKPVKKKHSSRKERANGEDASVAAGEPIEVPLGGGEQMKKSRKHIRRDADVTVAPLEETSDPKKKRDDGVDTETAADISDAHGDATRRKEKVRKRRKQKRSETEAEDAGEGDDAGRTRGKKHNEAAGAEDHDKGAKKKRTLKEDEDADYDHANAGTAKKHKKMRKHKSTQFINPREDKSLNEQARKALEYAFGQFEDPTSWKFQKARQNWLIRNVWSEEAIPEAHMPLLMHYLMNVQGGAREALIHTCHENAPDSSSADASNKNSPKLQSAPVIPATATGDINVKHRRAEALLAVLSTNDMS